MQELLSYYDTKMKEQEVKETEGSVPECRQAEEDDGGELDGSND